MKLFNKVASFAIALSLVGFMKVSVSAAANDDVINALKAANVPQTYIIQAENYLKNNTITDAQASAVESQITTAKNIMSAANVTDVSKLSAADKQSVINAITSAGQAIDLNISVAKQSDGTYAISAKDKNGVEVLSFTSNEVKQTGVDNTLIAIGSVLVLLSAGSVLVIKKAKANA